MRRRKIIVRISFLREPFISNYFSVFRQPYKQDNYFCYGALVREEPFYRLFRAIGAKQTGFY